jgi:hypothetical protein
MDEVVQAVVFSGEPGAPIDMLREERSQRNLPPLEFEVFGLVNDVANATGSKKVSSTDSRSGSTSCT